MVILNTLSDITRVAHGTVPELRFLIEIMHIFQHNLPNNKQNKRHVKRELLAIKSINNLGLLIVRLNLLGLVRVGGRVKDLNSNFVKKVLFLHSGKSRNFNAIYACI